MLVYAGIGSTESPEDILREMEAISESLSTLGYTLRSGGAIGADRAFESKAVLKEIFYAEDANSESIELASKFHPAWGRCKEYARKLHGRNAKIILGNDLKSPVNFVVCWTKDGKDIGGTGLGIRMATHYSIPILNLYKVKIDFVGGKLNYTPRIVQEFLF